MSSNEPKSPLSNSPHDAPTDGAFDAANEFNEALNAANNPLTAELQKAQEETEKFKKEYLYMRAEFENYKRNAIKERADLLKFGSERFIRDFLAVVDNFDRALTTQVNAETWQNFVQGVELTAKQMRDLLQKHGVQEIPSEGVPFDPAVHEALGSEPTAEVPEGHISKTFAKAYKMHDKVIRPGQVIVARKP